MTDAIIKPSLSPALASPLRRSFRRPWRRPAQEPAARDDLDLPEAFGASDDELARLGFTTARRSLEDAHWAMILAIRLGVRTHG